MNFFRKIFACAFFVPFLFSCGTNRNENASGAVPVVRAAAVVSREVIGEVRSFGSLTYQKKIDIAAPADAVIETIYKREGDPVQAGDVVAILSNPQITLSVTRAESSFSQAKAALDLAEARLCDGAFQAEARLLENEKAGTELEQFRRSLEEQRRKHANDEALYSAGGLSDEAILDSRFKMESAEVQLALMEKELEIRKIGLRESDLEAAGIVPPDDARALRQALISLATTGLRAEAAAAAASLEAAKSELESGRFLEASLVIRSPMSGIVGSRYMEEGERIQREAKIITIMDTGALYAVFTVPETDALKIAKGFSASVSVDGTGMVYDGTVDLVSPHADAQSFSFLVRVILNPDESRDLKPGMFSRITVFMDQRQSAVLVPELSLTEKRNDRAKVFTIRGNVVSERIVELGQLYGEDREITTGLSAGEVVVLKPDRTLQDGTYVSVAN